MSLKRTAAKDAADERPTRRQRLEEEAPNHIPKSLDGINNDCMLLIFQHLSTEDLNSIAICGPRYRDVRSHDSLDQTRTGTIECTENTTVTSIMGAFLRQEWNQVFTGNRTRMEVVGLERIPRVTKDFVRSPNQVLPNIISLDISFSPLDENRGVQSVNNVRVFSEMLPGLQDINLSYMRLPTLDRIFRIFQMCRMLKVIKLNGFSHGMYLDGSGGGRPANVMEIHHDEAQLVSIHAEYHEWYSMEYDGDDEEKRNYLFCSCSHLERLSIINLTWALRSSETAHPVTQEMLIKMVRYHPTLRWLRSDLTQENIVMLQQERPEITFVSE